MYPKLLCTSNYKQFLTDLEIVYDDDLSIDVSIDQTVLEKMLLGIEGEAWGTMKCYTF